MVIKLLYAIHAAFAASMLRYRRIFGQLPITTNACRDELDLNLKGDGF